MPDLATFTNDGLTFELADGGPRDGEPVVLLHGWPQTHTSWAAVVPELHARGFRTLAPDQRGYSAGARPRHRAGYRLAALVGDIRALVEQVGRPVHLVGHDWGAAVAWSFAAQHPGSVRTLTTVSVPHPGAFVRSLVTSDQALRSWYFLAFQLPLLPELLLGRPSVLAGALARTGMSPAGVERVRREVVERGALSASLHWYRGLPLGAPSVLRRTVPVPTTHVWGTGDTALSRRGAELARHYVSGDFELVTLDGATHWIPDERPAELASVIARRARAAGSPDVPDTPEPTTSPASAATHDESRGTHP